ncbi:ADP-ribose pyrophosphatase YjhB (NUDIX family) [Actinomycetospora succinea]|uniref:ADP-ribose pyrophosphatase YjhB (NUDIX family) n=1 Tax=Actinomycetospora succinea TaxID=663603 RepID=A0A4R6V9V1_9PSEU|nr:NUDIX domain-containing protein [Actinomycetospora succinea]TDQ58483.1 ADP-ribose pyrophosphatase YjhB (NUDIX family) [Actinomycetospora succinea]
MGDPGARRGASPDTSGDIPCVGGIVTDPDGRLLLIRRAHDPEAGRWSLPGGKVEPGESVRAATAREVAEETGLEVAVGEEVGHVRRPAPDGRVFAIHDFRCRPLDPAAAPRAGDDAADARWVDGAAYAALDAAGELVSGLTVALRGWDCLPSPSGAQDGGAARR